VGVNYRSLVKSIAESMGVKGFAKNLADDKVEIACECNEKTFEEFKEKIFVKSSSFFGPNVEKITVEKPGSGRKPFEGFRIEF